MTHRRPFVVVAAVGLLACVAATAGTLGAQAAPAASSAASASSAYADTTYQVTREAAYGTNRYTVFRPSNPSSVGRTLPVVVWGPGACNHDSNNENRSLLTTIASRGIVVVSEGSVSGSSTGVGSGSPNVSLMTGGISWAQTENSRSGATLKGRLDLSRVAVAGHSCGGLEALAAGADSRVAAVISFNSGFFADGSFGHSRSELQKLHSPVLFVDGGSSDVAYSNTRANYDLVSKVPAVLAEHSSAGHTGIVAGNQVNDGALGAVQFLDYAFNKTSSARSYVVNTWKSKSGWSIRTKNSF